MWLKRVRDGLEKGRSWEGSEGEGKGALRVGKGEVLGGVRR